MKTNNYRRAICAFLTGAFLGASAQGETSGDLEIFELAPYFVEVSGTQNRLQITERDLSLRQATDLEDALSIDPSVTVGGSTNVAQKIYIRNLGEGVLNISIDGATQTGSLFHHTGRVHLEPELLKQVEIQSGMGSVTDGPGSLGGAVHFVTKDPEDLLRGQRVGGLIKYGYYGNTEGYKVSSSAYAQIDESWSGMLSYVYSDHENMVDGDGNEIIGSNSEQEVWMAKAVGKFSGGQVLRVSYERFDESGIKLQRPEWDLIAFNTAYPMAMHRDTMTANYEIDSEENDWLNLKANLSVTNSEIEQDGKYGLYIGEIKGVQFSLSNAQEWERNTLIYGFDYRDDRVEMTDVPVGEDLADYSPEQGDVYGFFVENTYSVSEPFDVIVGFRYDNYSLHDTQSLDFEDDGFSPSVALSYDLAEGLNLKLSSAQAFRGPEVNDVFLLGIANNDANMEGETARNHEITLTYVKEALSFEVGAFKHEINDVITVSIPWSKNFGNVGKLETEGFFARAGYRGENWNVGVLYNQADTTLNGLVATRYEYGSVVSTIGNTWVLDSSWSVLPQLNVGWNIRLVEGIDDIYIPERYAGIPDAFISKPGYVTHDFFLQWTPESFEYLTMNLTVKNVFDKLYRNHGGIEDLESIPGFEGVIGAYDAGRDIRISATLRF